MGSGNQEAGVGHCTNVLCQCTTWATLAQQARPSLARRVAGRDPVLGSTPPPPRRYKVQRRRRRPEGSGGMLGFEVQYVHEDTLQIPEQHAADKPAWSPRRAGLSFWTMQTSSGTFASTTQSVSAVSRSFGKGYSVFKMQMGVICESSHETNRQIWLRGLCSGLQHVSHQSSRAISTTIDKPLLQLCVP